MKEISSEIEVNAPPERVWQVLSNFAAYPNWNPFIRGVAGRAKTDSQVALQLQPPGGKTVVAKVRVTRVEANRELCWRNSLWGIPHLVDAEHRFTIEAIDGQRCRFVQREAFGGLFVPMLTGLLARFKRGYDEMNQALKSRAEKG